MEGFLETIEEYERIMEILNSKNSQGHLDIESMSSKTSSKISRLRGEMERRNRERLSVPVEEWGVGVGWWGKQPMTNVLQSMEDNCGREKDGDRDRKENRGYGADVLQSFKKYVKPKKRYDTEHDAGFDRLLE